MVHNLQPDRLLFLFRAAETARRAILLCWGFSFLSLAAFSQKQVTRFQQLWTGYFNQTRLSEHWGAYADLQLFTRDHLVSHLNETIASAGVQYYFGNSVRLTAAYSYVNVYPFDNHPSIPQLEHRPWEQVQWFTQYPRFRITQGFRLEQRFRRKTVPGDALAKGFTYNGRFRYAITAMLPLSDKAFAANTVSLVVNNEFFLNFGGRIVYNYFDQNRFFAGINYHISPSANLQLGYLNVFQQLPAGNQYRSINAPRIFFFHSLDVRR